MKAKAQELRCEAGTNHFPPMETYHRTVGPGVAFF